MIPIPLTIREASAFVARHHRHRRAPQGGLFALGLAVGTDVVGVAIVGRPVARALQDGWTAEVTRVCSEPAAPKGTVSKLLTLAKRAAQALGYRRVVTYTLDSESGASLRGAGWREVARVRAGSWSRPSRPRVDLYPDQDKIRWEAPLPRSAR